jgi:hypothetical protein
MTDEDIRATIRHWDSVFVQRGSTQGAYLTLDGYEDDPRELADIPEAMDLLRRFVSLGGLGLLAYDPESPTGRPGLARISHPEN